MGQDSAGPGLPREHPLRRALSDELHGRPYARLVAPQRATHLAFLTGEGEAAADRRHVAALCERCGAPPPGEADTHLMADLGAVRLKWERHTEFSTYTFYLKPEGDAAEEPFANPVIGELPADWLGAIPGEMLVGVHLEFLPRTALEHEFDDVTRLFGTDNLAGSEVAGGAAVVWMDFRIHGDGFGRILVHDRGLRPRQAGRLIQRMLEIETYRSMALLALPLARRFGAQLTEGRDRLSGIASRVKAIDSLDDERRMLRNLTELSAEVEETAGPAAYRFGAARAYYALVQRRVDELRESRIEGVQTIDEFLDRRLAPAMRTCEAVAERLARLSERISRTTELLRTRVDIQLEAQNSALLHSMNRRARLQLRLQQTVEGLSVAAISYYLVGLISYVLKTGKAAGLPVDVELMTGLSVPVVVAVLAFGLWRMRRALHRDEEQSDL